MSDLSATSYPMTDVLDERCCFVRDLSSIEAASATRCPARATIHIMLDPYSDQPTTMTCDDHFHTAARGALDTHPLEMVCLSPASFWGAPWPEKGIASHCAPYAILPDHLPAPTESDPTDA